MRAGSLRLLTETQQQMPSSFRGEVRDSEVLEGLFHTLVASSKGKDFPLSFSLLHRAGGTSEALLLHPLGLPSR